MEKIRDILNWYFNSSNFKYQAEHLFLDDTKNQFNDSISEIKELTARLPKGDAKPAKKLITDVYNLFQANYKLQYSDFSLLFGRRDVRILVWTLDYKPNENSQVILFNDEQFTIAKRIILDKWKDSFIISLWYKLIENWNIIQSYYNNQRTRLVNLLKTKCEDYEQSREHILNISTNINLFIQTDSPKKYANILLDNRIPITEANSLVNQKETVLYSEYYAAVFEEYVKIISKGQIEEKSILSIYDFLGKYKFNKKTKLLMCSYLINETKFDKYIEIIKNQTVNVIGDPIKDYLWKCGDLTINQEKDIQSAKNKLLRLLNKEFIEIFFETLVQDPRRKKYWSKLIDEIDKIEFVGNRNNHRYLKGIESISEFVDGRYKTTTSNKATCALIMYSRGFVFVEFSDSGALYIYRNSSFDINLDKIKRIEELKMWGTYKNACVRSWQQGYYDLDEEGRITHQGNWESRIDVWMERYYYE